MEVAGFQKKQKKTEAVSGWSELPHDMLRAIYKFVVSASVDDFLTLRKVCKPWRAAATKDIVYAQFSKPCLSVPYLMLPEKEGSQEREFYSLIDKKVFMTISLPEAQGKRCIEARFGWLLAYDDSGEAKLLNPITGSEIHLPDFRTLCTESEPIPFHYLARAVLSTSPSCSSGFILVVMTREGNVGFWRNGDGDWTRIHFPMPLANMDRYYAKDVNYHTKDHKFYVITFNGYIYALDSTGSVVESIFDLNPRLGIEARIIRILYEVYLVESSTTGELLLVQRCGSYPFRLATDHYTHRYGTNGFNVFRVDFGMKCFQVINSVEDEAIFIGHNAAFSIPASGVIKPNSIYFSDDSTLAYLWSYHTCENCGENTYKNAKLCENIQECRKMEIKREIEMGRVDTLLQMQSSLRREFDTSKGGGKDMGIYSLKDRKIERFHEQVQSLSFICPSLWISLSS